MRVSSARIASLLFIAIHVLGGCGGGSGSSAAARAGSAGSAGNTATTPVSVDYALGGTVRGLVAGTSVVLTANSGEHVTVTADRDFVFSNKVHAGSSYQVQIATDPANQTCVAYRASGVAAANVADVDIVCNAAPVLVQQTGVQVTHFAGRSGIPGALDGPALQATMYCPFGIAVDKTGVVYITDTKAQVVRKIGIDGQETTVAGLPLKQLSDVLDGNVSVATFNAPGAIVLDSTGNLYVSELIEHAIRRITPSGTVSTIIGSFHASGSQDGTSPDAQVDQLTAGVADASDNLYFVDFFANTVRKLTPRGVMSTLAGTPYVTGAVDGAASGALFNGPFGIALAPDGALYIAERANHTIRKISNGIVSTVAGVAGVAGNSDGNGAAARFNKPSGLAVDLAGNLYIVDSGNHAIRMMTPAGAVTTIAGDASAADGVDGYGKSAHFIDPYQLAVDSHGALYVADCGDNTVRRIAAGTTTAQVVVSAPQGTYPATGVVTTLAGTSGQSGYVDGTGADARIGQSVAAGTGIAVDARGYLYVADPRPNNVVRLVSPAGVVSTFAGTRGSQAAADGTAQQASFGSLTNIAIAPDGVLYAADGAKIRKITAAGVVTSIVPAPNFEDNPAFLAVTSTGTIVATDNLANEVVQITPAGAMSILAGFHVPDKDNRSFDAVGGAARFDSVGGLAVDSQGNAYVADIVNHTVRKVTPAGVTTTYAGKPGMAGNVDGTADNARFMSPVWIAVDAAGNVYVAESHNVIRKIGTDGMVTTVAGLSGTAGSADGVGAAARFTNINAMTVDAGGTLYVVDNGAVRKIVQK